MVFIDWDGAGPSTRLWDLAYAAISFGRLFPTDEPEAAASRLNTFVNGYDAEEHLRAALPATMARRARAMHTLLLRSQEVGEQPWASMYTDGHGQHWDSTAGYIAQHQHVWRCALSE